MYLAQFGTKQECVRKFHGNISLTFVLTQVKQKVLLISSEDDNIVDNKLAEVSLILLFLLQFSDILWMPTHDTHRRLIWNICALLTKTQRLQDELPNATIRKISNCGHLPHIEKPNVIAKLIIDFTRGGMNAAICEAKMPVSYFVDDKSCKTNRLCRKGEWKNIILSSTC